MKTNEKRKRVAIRTKLSRQVGIMVIVALIIISGSACYAIGRILDGQAKQQLLLEADYLEAEIEGWTDGILKEVNTILTTVKSIGIARDSETLLQYLKAVTMGLDENMPTGVYAGTEKGEYLDPSGWVPDASYNVKERSWFIEGKNNETMTFGAPYYGDNLQSNMVSASARVDDNMILATDVTLGSIEKVISEMQVTGDGYAFLMDAESGFMVAHKNQEYTGKMIQDLDDTIVQKAYENRGVSEEVLLVKDGDNKHFVTIHEVENTNWVLVICADRGVIFKTLYKIVGAFFGFSVALTVLIGTAIYIRVKKITAPLEGLTSVITEITNGNLTVQPVVEGNDEITEMSEAMEGFIRNNRGGIADLSAVSQMLLAESDNSTEISNEMNEASNSQTEAMKQLNVTVEELARSIEEIANDATALASTVSDANQYGSEAEQMIGQTITATNEGKEAIQQVSTKMNTIDETMKQLEAVVKEVGESSNEINSITSLIGNIASETNLLALNASIEAARAGEAGKGFAVVASEIGNLAASSTDAVNQIATLITKICTQVQNVVEKTASSVQDIRESKGLVEHTSETFLDIYDKVNTTANALEAVTKKVQEVDEVASNMAAITEEQSAGTEEILATSESVYSQSIAITKSSEVLRDTANKLHASAENIKEFTEKYQI